MISDYSHFVRAFLPLALAILAVAERTAVAQSPVNKICPVTLEEADPTITSQYEGKTIAFCCDTCLKKFQANPQRYARQLENSSSGHDDQAGHQHATSGSAIAREHEKGTDDAPMPFVARIHPIVVHFPLAGTPIAMVAMLGWLVSRKTLFAFGDVPPIVLAAASSVIGVVTGNMAHDSMRFSDALHDYVEWHQFTATSLMILLLILSGIRLWRWRRLDGEWLVAYAGGLAVACSLVVGVGDLGGSLVFGPDHLLP